MRSLFTLATLGLALAASAQEPNDMIELLRHDLRTERQAIVLSTLALNKAQTALFMPVFEAYTAEMRTHWDARLKLVDDYHEGREAMSDEQATTFLKRLFALERDDVALRERYAKEAKKVLPATVAARWMQIERRLGQLMELQIANEVPLAKP